MSAFVVFGMTASAALADARKPTKNTSLGPKIKRPIFGWADWKPEAHKAARPSGAAVHPAEVELLHSFKVA